MTLNWTSYDVWQQEKTILIASGVSGKLTATATGFGGTYTPDASNRVRIDLTDFTHTLVIGESRQLTLTDSADTKTATISVVGFINPATMLIPMCRAIDVLKANEVDLPHIVLPSVILKGSAVAELNIGSGVVSVTGGTYDATTHALTINSGASEVVVKVDGVLVQTTRLADTDCSKHYADVKWQAASGAVKAMRFLVADHTIAAGDGYELMTDTINYSQHQSRKEGLTLRLDNLTPYDYWYYSDLATASEAAVSVDGGEFEFVRINGKGLTIPNGGNKPSKLEIKIDWREYDVL